MIKKTEDGWVVIDKDGNHITPVYKDMKDAIARVSFMAMFAK